MAITHESITDRLREIEGELEAAEARATKESESLQELCGGIGHKWGESCSSIVSHTDGGATFQRVHYCDICGHEEAVA